MIDGVTGNKPLPANIRLDIIERTDGIPLFVEEMTKAVLEAEGEGAAEHTVAIPSRVLRCPQPCMHLDGALDRLGPAKQVAQIGAALGREFSHALSRRLHASRRRSCRRRWTVLLRLVCCFGRACRRTRLICSNMRLVQDAAYGTLLREPRRALHARIADTLESQFVDIAENQPELLARHCTEAGPMRRRRACGAWRASGHWSARRWSKPQFSSPEPSTRLRPCPYARSTSRADQATGGTCEGSDSHKGICAETRAALDQARSLIEQAEAAGRTYRRSYASLFSPLRLLGSELCRVNGMRLARLAHSFWPSQKSKRLPDRS